ncbi:MAG: DUF2157 domain-containing protein [Alphaproteobacteria bacterium]
MHTVSHAAIPLDKIPANRQMLEELRARNLLSPQAHADALEMIHPPRNWGLWVSRLLLGLGVTLVLSGIVYFFAFNWAAVPDFAKFGLIITGFIGCVASACLVGLDRVTGQMLATSAGVLVGVFLAVFGQVYQTGADAWNLFAAWAVLIVPMALAARNAPLWAVFAVVSNIGIALYWDQIVAAGWRLDIVIFTVLAIFNTVLLAARELLAEKMEWLAARWTRGALLLPTIAFTAVAPFDFFTSSRGWNGLENDSTGLYAMISAVMLGGFFCFYRKVKPDMHALAATALACCLVLETAVYRFLREGFGFDEAGFLVLTLGAATIALFGGAVVWLRKTARIIETEALHV